MEVLLVKKKNMSGTIVINLRVDPELKEEANKLFKKMGMSTSTAIKLFLTQCVEAQGIPLELRVPNTETMKAIEEGRKGIGLSKEYDSVEEMFNDILSEED